MAEVRSLIQGWEIPEPRGHPALWWRPGNPTLLGQEMSSAHPSPDSSQLRATGLPSQEHPLRYSKKTLGGP